MHSFRSSISLKFRMLLRCLHSPKLPLKAWMKPRRRNFSFGKLSQCLNLVRVSLRSFFLFLFRWFVLFGYPMASLSGKNTFLTVYIFYISSIIDSIIILYDLYHQREKLITWETCVFLETVFFTFKQIEKEK